MKFYMFTSLLTVVMAQDISVIVDDDSNKHTMQMQETIEQQKYTQVLNNYNDNRFNQNINVPNKLKLKNIPIQSTPGSENYDQNNQRLYMDNKRDQYNYLRPPMSNHQPLGTLPYTSDDIQRPLFYRQQQPDYNRLINASTKEMYIHKIIKLYSKIKTLSQYINNYNYNYNKNVDWHNYYWNNHNTINHGAGAKKSSISCNNGLCTLCVNRQCKSCNSKMGKCQICNGGACSSVNG